MNVVLVAVLLALVEGTASLMLFVDAARETPAAIAERHSTRPDSELGWVAIPNFSSPDFYGPGRMLQTERHGFRNSHDVTTDVQDGALRLVCSGDSFTLGYGVDNQDTWCHLLGKRLGVEAVNMGQGGYGIDQAYLWYRRDGTALQHQLHLFAFIEDDFRRAQAAEFRGIPKPTLSLVDGELSVVNDHVRPASWARRMRQKLAAPASRLRLVALASRIRGRLGGGGDRPGPAAQATLSVVCRIFEELKITNQAKGSQLVLVYLPTLHQHQRDEDRPGFWQSAVGPVAESVGVPLLDLTTRLQELPGNEVRALFIPRDSTSYPGAAGHYSEAGNRWAAQILEEQLRAIPEVAERLARQASPTAASSRW